VNQKLRSVATSAIILLGACTLAGCGPSPQDGASTPNAQSPTPTPPSTQAAPVEEPAADLGDVAVKTDESGDPVVITDEFGTYQKVTIDPDAGALTVDASTVDPTVAATGWTDADVLSAQSWLVAFIAEEGVDSIAIDGLTGWDEWKATKAAAYVAPEWSSFLDDPTTTTSDRPPFITNNLDNLSAVTVRDGSPRVNTSLIAVDLVRGWETDGVATLGFSGLATTEYRVEDADMIDALKRANPALTDADAIADSPELGDGVEGGHTVGLEYMFAVRQDAESGWLITGFDNRIVDGR
jgi:hypothetical protein